MSGPRVFGQCRWCSETILQLDGSVNFRRLWHPQCADRHDFLFKPRAVRRALRKRDKKICAQCGVKCNSTNKPWQSDHSAPLFLSHGRVGFFELHNLATMCVEHHMAKTAVDMDNYRKWKKGERILVKKGQVSDLYVVRSEFSIFYHPNAEKQKAKLLADMDLFKPLMNDVK